MHGITIGVDFVLVIIWFSLCMRLSVCLCVLIMLFLTGGASFVVGFSVPPFFILFYSSPVLNLSAIASIKLT